TTGRAARGFASFDWITKDSWTRRRRVVAKAEWRHGNRYHRFIVTTLPQGMSDPRHLYEQIYCARGDMENRIKECQMDLFSDRTSSHTIRANQLRLWFSAAAYVLLTALQKMALGQTSLEKATCGTIRARLLKIATRVTLSVRRIVLSMPDMFPCQHEFALAHARLRRLRQAI
ncbi:transposase, partial [Acetobacter pasteurianus]|uniref:transposase n=2 Tax=Acetobacter pasteurianus TaxID=438 RepID=UPI0011CE7262